MIYCTVYNWCDVKSRVLGLGTHLFVKVPRPGDSEGTFSVKLPPVTTSLTTQSPHLERGSVRPSSISNKMISWCSSTPCEGKRCGETRGEQSANPCPKI